MTSKITGADEKKTDTVVTLEAIKDKVTAKISIIQHNQVEAEAAGEVKLSTIEQGYLEGSNVNVATEMVNLIVAQRAYEMNSTAIQTTDEMMQTANGLKR